MNRDPLGETSQLTEDLIDKFRVRPSLLSRLRSDRRARRLDHGHQAHNQQLAWRVQDILVGCGLVHADYSIAGGRVFHIPQVISVDPGPLVRFDIRILPGQMPDDFAAHARTIAYNLDVSEVRVLPLGPYLIRLELLPKLDSAWASIPRSQSGDPLWPDEKTPGQTLPVFRSNDPEPWTQRQELGFTVDGYRSRLVDGHRRELLATRETDRHTLGEVQGRSCSLSSEEA